MGLSSVSFAVARRRVQARTAPAARLIQSSGARLTVSDIDEPAVDRAVKEFAAQPVAVDEVPGVECDVLTPCAGRWPGFKIRCSISFSGHRGRTAPPRRSPTKSPNRDSTTGRISAMNKAPPHIERMTRPADGVR